VRVKEGFHRVREVDGEGEPMRAYDDLFSDFNENRGGSTSFNQVSNSQATQSSC
jgi:hypothetical protein